jgi:hypothetical protein
MQQPGSQQPTARLLAAATYIESLAEDRRVFIEALEEQAQQASLCWRV